MSLKVSLMPYTDKENSDRTLGELETIFVKWLNRRREEQIDKNIMAGYEGNSKKTRTLAAVTPNQEWKGRDGKGKGKKGKGRKFMWAEDAIPQTLDELVNLGILIEDVALLRRFLRDTYQALHSFVVAYTKPHFYSFYRISHTDL